MSQGITLIIIIPNSSTLTSKSFSKICSIEKRKRKPNQKTRYKRSKGCNKRSKKEKSKGIGINLDPFLHSVERPRRETGRARMQGHGCCAVGAESFLCRRRVRGKRGGKECGEPKEKKKGKRWKKEKRKRDGEGGGGGGGARNNGRGRTICHSANVALAKGRPGSECIPRRPRAASLQFGPRRTQVTACTPR